MLKAIVRTGASTRRAADARSVFRCSDRLRAYSPSIPSVQAGLADSSRGQRTARTATGGGSADCPEAPIPRPEAHSGAIACDHRSGRSMV